MSPLKVDVAPSAPLPRRQSAGGPQSRAQFTNGGETSMYSKHCQDAGRDLWVSFVVMGITRPAGPGQGLSSLNCRVTAPSPIQQALSMALFSVAKAGLSTSTTFVVVVVNYKGAYGTARKTSYKAAKSRTTKTKALLCCLWGSEVIHSCRFWPPSRAKNSPERADVCALHESMRRHVR